MLTAIIYFYCIVRNWYPASGSGTRTHKPAGQYTVQQVQKQHLLTSTFLAAAA